MRRTFYGRVLMAREGETRMATKVQLDQAVRTTENGHAQLQGRQPLDAELIEGLDSEEGLRVAEDVYWEKYYDHPDFDYEWNNGVLEAKPMSDYVKYSMYEWLVVILREFLQVHPIARKMALEMGFRLELPGQKVTVRKPDLFVVRNDNLAPLGDLDRTYHGICDLCIESISDSSKKEIERDTVQKKQEYADFGVREYYILDPSAEHTAFYQLTPAGDYADINAGAEGVIRSDVLPGFRFRIADLYRQPQLIELVEDEIYREFVLLEYQAEKARADYEHALMQQERARAEQAQTDAEQAQTDAEQARTDAEQARTDAKQARADAEQAQTDAEQQHARAEQERMRAERLAARLRALGIDEEME